MYTINPQTGTQGIIAHKPKKEIKWKHKRYLIQKEGRKVRKRE